MSSRLALKVLFAHKIVSWESPPISLEHTILCGECRNPSAAFCRAPWLSWEVLPDSERCARDISSTKRGHFWRKGIFQYRSFGRLAHQKQSSQRSSEQGRQRNQWWLWPPPFLWQLPSVTVLSLVSSDSSQGRSRCPVIDACCLLSQIALKISFGKKPKCEGAILF